MMFEYTIGFLFGMIGMVIVFFWMNRKLVDDSFYDGYDTGFNTAVSFYEERQRRAAEREAHEHDGS